MMLMIVAVLSFTIINGIQTQGSPDYYLDDAYLEQVNSEYLDPNNTSFELERINSSFSGISSKFTVMKTLPPEATLHLNIFEKSMGAYDKPIGISISMKYCTALKNPVLTRSLPSAGNMTTAACPLPPGTYSFEKWHPSTSLVMALDPGKQYRNSFRIEYEGTVVVELSTTYSVE